MNDAPSSSIQVVEITSSCAGAYTGRQLAEAGLAVLRLEIADHTPLHQLPPFDAQGNSIPWLSMNGKKENVRVDMSTSRGREFVDRIIKRSAVFVTDMPAFFDARSQQITCHIHADRIGVASDLPSTDILMQAMSGALSMTGPLQGPPTPIGLPIGDLAPGLFAAIGILRGLLQDQPQAIEVHALDATVALISYLGCSYIVSGEEIGFVGSGHPFVTPYGAYRAKDGYIIVAPGFTQVFWQNLCRMLNREDLIEDPRFGTLTNRRKHRNALQEILDAAFSQDTVEAWESRLDKADVPNGPIRPFRQVLAHPATAVRGMVTDIQGRSFLSSPLIDNTALPQCADRPTGGRAWKTATTRHLGMSSAEIESLLHDHVVRPLHTPYSPHGTPPATADAGTPCAAARQERVPRILDLTRMLAGPFGTMILGDLGFEVIKVEEKKSGDYTRRTPPYRNGMSAYFFAANRNKKSIIVDLKSPEGRAVILDIVKTADAVVENFRPGVMEHLNLGYEALAAVNPGIILVSINGFGSTGPLKDKTSFDLVAQAMAGAMALSTEGDSEPVKPAIPLGDVGGGLYAALGVTRAMLERLSTGRGKHLEVSLLDAMLAMAGYVGEQFLLQPTDSDQPLRFVPNGVFRTQDGHIAVAAYTNAAWQALCTALDWKDWASDSRFQSINDRSHAGVEIKQRLAHTLTSQASAKWLAVFEAAGVGACPIANLEAVFNNQALDARGMLPEIDQLLTGTLKTFGNPIRRLDAPYRAATLPPPQHGEHTQDILRNVLNYSPEKIESLLACDAVSGPKAATP